MIVSDFSCAGFRWIGTYETFAYRKANVRTATLRAIRINVANYSHWKLSQMNALNYHWLWMKRQFSIDQLPISEKYCIGKNENSRDASTWRTDVNPLSILKIEPPSVVCVSRYSITMYCSIPRSRVWHAMSAKGTPFNLQYTEYAIEGEHWVYEAALCALDTSTSNCST